MKTKKIEFLAANLLFNKIYCLLSNFEEQILNGYSRTNKRSMFAVGETFCFSRTNCQKGG